ncbi:serine hydrolase [Actinoplanes sp. DH11]|uniref:serine hydrolase domain-containing protein n=1 Tax=Actinoplanes sp. DH11 TaxID=2857011 RepID=UPI001E4108DA|nr:serine hydrolase domain-containing protein [Actinoplanes sp. DH11]
MTDLVAACRTIGGIVRRDPRYAHTSHLRVLVGGSVVFDEHYRGPVVADVFSVTKTVVASVAGIAARQGLLPDLDQRLPHGATWRQLFTMTRGAATDGPWDIDTVTALPGGQVARIAAAPVREPGAFGYDNGAFHLLSAALQDVLGRPVAEVAETELFRPLGITDAVWPADPDGVTWGFAHLRLSAESLGRLGELWRAGGRPLLDPGFAAEMFRAHSAGGPPESLPYGFGVWVGDDGLVLAGGWAGQHVVVLPGAVVVTTGDPRFDVGPPPTDALPADWQPALGLIREHLLPLL